MSGLPPADADHEAVKAWLRRFADDDAMQTFLDDLLVRDPDAYAQLADQIDALFASMHAEIARIDGETRDLKAKSIEVSVDIVFLEQRLRLIRGMRRLQQQVLRAVLRDGR